MRRLLIVVALLWGTTLTTYAKFQLSGKLRMLRPTEIVLEDLSGKEIVRCEVKNNQPFKTKAVNITPDLYKLKLGKLEQYVLLTNDPLTLEGFLNENNPDQNRVTIQGLKMQEEYDRVSAEFGKNRDSAAEMLKRFGEKNSGVHPLVALSVVYQGTLFLDLIYEPFAALLKACEAEAGKSQVYGEMKKMIDPYASFAIGGEAYDFRLQDAEGNMHALADFRGKIVLIDFWASWCGPCRMEMKSLHKIHDEIKGDDLQFISISLDGEREKWLKAMAEDQIPWLALWEGLGNGDKGDAFQESLVRQRYGFLQIPFIVLIDKEGRTVKRFLRGEDVRTEIEKLREKYK